ncbi:hypothetical protein ACFV2H_31930 [Streptomyces sp. NPDC059629]|uniref:hypothetical protein n=1 Tax=Streptomyces sp. NPDC059629 TaxID=3346889 RepID=UPI0036C221AE
MAQHIVLVVAEGLRPAHLERLAARGVLFPRTVAAAPYPSAAFAACLTGMWPRRNGIFEMYNRGLRVPTLFSAARAHGFRTVLMTDAPSVIGPHLGFTRDTDTFLPAAPDTIRPQAGRGARRTLQVVYLSCPPVPGEPGSGERSWLTDRIEELTAGLAGTDYLLGVMGSPRWDWSRTDGSGRPASVESHPVGDAALSGPLLFLGPGVAAGVRRPERVRGIDLAATVVARAGWESRRRLDGDPLPLGPAGGTDGADRNTYVQAFVPDREKYESFVARVTAAGRKTGFLKHTLRAECFYDGPYRLARYHLPSAVLPTVVLHRWTGECFEPDENPTRAASLSSRLDAYGAPVLSRRTNREVPGHLRAQLQAMGYRI